MDNNLILTPPKYLAANGLEDFQDSIYSKTDRVYVNRSIVLSRKDVQRKFRDHIKVNSPTAALAKEGFVTFLNKTYSTGRGATTLDQASAELERQATKLQRLQKEMENIHAVRHELNLKRSYVAEAVQQYPNLMFNR